MLNLKYYEKFCSILDTVIRNLIVLLIYSTIFIISLQVVSRIFLGFSIVWMMEYVRYVLSFVTVGGASCLIRSGEHIKIDFLVKRLPVKLRLFFSSISLLFLMYFLSFYVIHGFAYAIMGIDRLSTSGVFSLFYPRIIIPIGAMLIIIQSVNIFINNILEIIKTTKGN